MKPPKPWSADKLASWNKANPVGTTCWIRLTTADPWECTKTRSEAWLLGHGAPVVMVEGKTGGRSVCYPYFLSGRNLDREGGAQ